MAKIKTGLDLGKFLKGFCEQTVAAKRGLTEAPASVGPGQSLLTDEDDDEDEPSSSGDDSVKQKDAKTMESGEVTTDAVVEKLNTIRAGRSFRDSAVKDALQKYIDGLDTAEKTALFAFLKGVAQITTGEIDPSAAVEPSEPEPAVTMQKKNTGGGEKPPSGGNKSYVKKPTVTHLGGGNKKTSAGEDTSAPIVAKKK